MFVVTIVEFDFIHCFPDLVFEFSGFKFGGWYLAGVGFVFDVAVQYVFCFLDREFLVVAVPRFLLKFHTPLYSLITTNRF